jgi:hypothetical protein
MRWTHTPLKPRFKLNERKVEKKDVRDDLGRGLVEFLVVEMVDTRPQLLPFLQGRV